MKGIKPSQGRYYASLSLLSITLLAAFIGSFFIGRFKIEPAGVLRALAGIVYKAFNQSFATGLTAQAEAIFYNVRLPRAVLSCLVGCCLSAAGASYQGVFQNPMAAPDILGASSGAAAGAALAILLELSGRMVMLFAFVSSLATIALVMAVSRPDKGGRLLRIVLSGIMASSLCNAATSFIKLVADPNSVLPEITYWMMGSLAKSKPADIYFAFFPMALGVIPLLVLRWRINVLTLSEEEARSIGVNVGLMRGAVIVSATLATAASVSVSGLIGWVGLVVPHLARKLVGNNFQYLLPVSMVGGALFLLITDNISRNLLKTEIPIGILTAVVGAPFFLSMIASNDRNF